MSHAVLSAKCLEGVPGGGADAQVDVMCDGGAARRPGQGGDRDPVAGAPDDRLPASRLPGRIVKDLRGMMASVVTSGTAAGMGLPAGTHAKTGSAEYGTGPESKLKIDGWLMGYDGDIAFAVVTHDTGGPTAARPTRRSSPGSWTGLDPAPDQARRLTAPPGTRL